MYLQLAENNYLADQCGLPPVKPDLGIGDEAKHRRNNPAKWADYDNKRKSWENCRAGKGKPTSIHPLKAVALAPGRAFFLLLIDYNIDGLASRLATENFSALSAQWGKLGGNPSSLAKYINKGKTKTPHRVGFLDKFKGAQALAECELCEDADGDENPNALSKSQKAAIIAATTTLGATIGATLPPTAPVAIPGGPILGTVIVGLLPFIKNSAIKNAVQETAGAIAPPIPETDQPGTDTGNGTSWLIKKNFTGFSNSATLLGAGNILAITGSAYLYKRKNNKKAAGLLLGATLAADVLYYFKNK